jgi:uncharacterized protein YciI
MLIAILKYTRPLEEVDALLPKHREYLQKLFDQQKAPDIHPVMTDEIV